MNNMKLIDFKDLFNWIHCNSIALKDADDNTLLKEYNENEDTYAGYFFIADDEFDDWYLEDQYSPVELTRKYDAVNMIIFIRKDK